MAARAAEDGTLDRSAEAAAWAAEWSTFYTDYLKRSAAQAENTQHLYNQLVAGVSKGEFTAATLAEMAAVFYRARGAAYAERLASTTQRFFSGLVEHAMAYSNEMAQSVMPGTPDPPALPQLDAKDPAGWFVQLADYRQRLTQHIATSYRDFFDRVAAGTVASADLQHLASEYLDRRFPEYIRGLGRLYFELLNELNDVRSVGEQEYLTGVLASVARPARRIALAVDLTAPVDSTASATLSITNSRNEPTQVHCRLSPVRRADGVGPAFEPSISISPQPLELAALQEATLEITVQLDPADYEPDRQYVGSLHISGHGEETLEVQLRIMARAVTPPSGELQAV